MTVLSRLRATASTCWTPLFDEVDVTATTAGMQTSAPSSEANAPSGNHPTGNSDDSLAESGANADAVATVLPGAFSSRQEAVLHHQRENASITTIASQSLEIPDSSPPLSRVASANSSSGPSTPEHIDSQEMEELCKVPSYATAMKMTRVPALVRGPGLQLPHYQAVVSAPSSPTSSVDDPLLQPRLVRASSFQDQRRCQSRGPSPFQSAWGCGQHSSLLALP